MLQYSKANAKLKKLYKVEALAEWLKFGRWDRKANVYSLDLLSGWSCPFAKDCKSKFMKLATSLSLATLKQN